MNNTTYTLITGASSGLGKEFSIQCAAMGMNIIMIALPGSHTDLLAAQLMREYEVEVKVLEFDLTDSRLLVEKLNGLMTVFDITFLINNAGIGGTVAITESSLESIDKIIQLNVRGTVLVTQTLLPHLLKHKKSHILNISSMAAFTPIAYKTVYPASKAFISSFSLGLREELHHTGVSVSVVYPGPIMTNSGVSTRIVEQGMKGRIGLLSTTEIVMTSLRQALAGKGIIIPGFWNRISHRLMSMLPTETKLRIVSDAVKKEMAVS